MQKSVSSEDYRRFRQLLRELRRQAGLSQTELAERLNRPQSFVSKAESGERRIDIIELRSFCQALGISLPEFIEQLEQALR